MSAIVERVAAAGGRIALAPDGMIDVELPADHAELLDEIRAHRAEVVAALRAATRPAVDETVRCAACGGSGKAGGIDCWPCTGSGRVGQAVDRALHRWLAWQPDTGSSR